jgi:hypothetical protein
MVCDDFANALETGHLYKRSWRATEDPYTDSVRAYYMMRHIALPWDHPSSLPAVMSALSESSCDILQQHQHLVRSLWMASHKIQGAHAMRERVSEAERDSDEDDYRRTDRWRAVQCVIWDAIQYREIGSERVSDWDLTRYDEEALNLSIRRGETFASMVALFHHPTDSKA